MFVICWCFSCAFVLVDAVPVHPEVSITQSFGDGNSIFNDWRPRDGVDSGLWGTPDVAQGDKGTVNGCLHHRPRLAVEQAKPRNSLGPLAALGLWARRSVILGAKANPVAEESQISHRRDLSRSDAVVVSGRRGCPEDG